MIEIIWEYRKRIFIVAVIAAVISLITSVLIPSKYKSTSIVYPANLQIFSEESPTEQLLQWLQSTELRKMFFENKQFDLLNRYNIDTSSELKETYFSWKYEENFRVKSTEFQSIEVSIIDKDPVMAQQLNMAMSLFTDSLIRKAHNLKLREFENMVSFAMKRQMKTIDSLKAQVIEMAEKYGINDYKIQLKEANKNYIKSLIKGGDRKELKDLLDNLGKKGPDHYLAIRMLETEIDHYNELKKEYDVKMKDLNKKFTYSVFIEKPNIPDSRYWPKRSLIVIVSVISTVALYIIFLLFSEIRFKRDI